MYRVLPFFTFLICLVFVFKVQHYIQRNKIFVRKCMLPLPKDQHLSLFHAILFPWKAYLLHEEYLDIKLAFDTQRGMDEEEARANEEMERQHEEERAAKEDVMRVAALREELARQKREAEAEAARQLAEKRRTLEQRLLKAFQSKNHPNRSKAIQDFNAAKKAKKDVRAVRFLEHGLALLCQEGDDKTANP